jgi:hypothetical protein
VITRQLHHATGHDLRLFTQGAMTFGQQLTKNPERGRALAGPLGGSLGRNSQFLVLPKQVSGRSQTLQRHAALGPERVPLERPGLGRSALIAGAESRSVAPAVALRLARPATRDRADADDLPGLV